MRTGIIISVWLCGVLSLAAVRAADTPPEPPEPTATAEQPAAAAEPADAAEQPPAPAEQPPAPAEQPPAPAEQPPAPAEQPPAPAEQPPVPGEQPAATPAQAPVAAETPPATPPAAPAATEKPPAPAPAPTAGSQSAPAALQTQPWDRYQVLVERNIFSRVRGPRPAPPMRPNPEPTRPPERYLILRGTIGRANDYVAFIEDTRTNETQVYQAGNTVRSGLIRAVGLDGLTFEEDGKTTHVGIGDYVGGTPSGGSASAGASAPAASEAAPSGGGSSIEERLRQRRMREEGR